MDLQSVQSIDETQITIKSPKDGRPTDWVVTVASYDSARVRDGQRARAKEMADRGGQIDIGDIDDQVFFSASVAVVSWDGLTDSGQEVECTRETTEKLLRAYPWFFEQVHNAARNRGLFIKA